MIHTENALSLTEALDAAAPDRSGLRMARSVPHGDYTAMRFRNGRIRIHAEGRGWIDAEALAPTIGWRPA